MKARIFSAIMAAFWTVMATVNALLAVSVVATGRDWVGLLPLVALGFASLIFGARRFIILVTGTEP